MPHAHQMLRCNQRRPQRFGQAIEDNFQDKSLVTVYL